VNKFTVTVEDASELLLPKYAEIFEEFIKRKQCQDEILSSMNFKTYRKKRNSVAFSPQANYTDRASDRRLSVKLVPTFADRGCRVVRATDPHGC
jgi:hypothetical protein